MIKHESPVSAVHRVLLSELGIDKPSNVLTMMLIDAVRDTTPPPREITIGMLTKILQSLDPSHVLDGWAVRSSREIVGLLSKRPEVRRVAELADDERIWCTLEGVIAGMLTRVCRGQDLRDPVPAVAGVSSALSQTDIKALQWLSDHSTSLPGSTEARIVLDRVIATYKSKP